MNRIDFEIVLAVFELVERLAGLELMRFIRWSIPAAPNSRQRRPTSILPMKMNARRTRRTEKK